MKLELLELSSAGGARVAALEYEARRPRGVTLAVAHGYSSSKHNLDFLCGFVASHGYRVVSIDFPGHKLGASGGRLDSIDALTDALGAAVRYARSTHAGPVYAAGHSMGATTALRVCAADEAVAGAISIASGYGRPSALQALGGLTGVDLRSAYVDGLTLQAVAEATEPLLDAALAALAGRPVLYVAADHDGMVSRTSAQELFARAPEPKTFVTIASDHTSAGENARAAVLAWLNERHPR
ncbi:MAG: lysophospholipase [Candidatus Eremiobacteraeota bacterium]|nr:lysophospholipase [Candidatus Eremiobacteraeota bacterium]